MKALLFISIGVLALLLLFTGCSSNQYVHDCYDKNDRLTYRKINNLLLHTKLMGKHDRCETYVLRHEEKK